MSLKPKEIKFDEVWGRVKDGLTDIFLLREVKKVLWMDLYQDTYSLCVAHPTPFAEDTYYAYLAFLKEHVKEIKANVESFEGTDLLKEYLKQWQIFDMGSIAASAVLRYVNDNWIKRRANPRMTNLAAGASNEEEIYEIRTLALRVWRDDFFVHVKDRLLNQLLRLINKDRRPLDPSMEDPSSANRDGEMADARLVTGVIQSYTALGLTKNKVLEVYREDFEAPFIADTNDYYARESLSYLAKYPCSEYMKKAEACLAEEEARAKLILDPSSLDKVKKENENTLIAKHAERLQSECESMIRQERISDLSRMYRLLKRIPDGVLPMLGVFQSYVTETGLARVKELGAEGAKDPVGYVTAVLAIYEKYKDVVHTAFKNDALCAGALDKAMRTIVNDSDLFGECKSSELLAKYCDLLLKKSKHNIEETALDGRMDSIIEIFQYIDEKDVFQKFYSRSLAKRLIGGLSISDDAESAMLSRLKKACGYEYVAKLQRMFQDLAVNEQLNSAFQEKKGSELSMDFSIQVLTAGSWPLQASSTTVTVPAELGKVMNIFELYYNNQHQGRKLSWLHQHSKGEVKTTYLAKNKEFQCTLYQMCVLLMFNKMDEASYELIGTQTQMKTSDVQRTVASLVSSKVLVCAGKDSKTKTFDAKDVFSINMEYTNKRVKIKISSALEKNTKAEDDATSKSIMEDRNYFLQAVVVRVMKARKRMEHAALVEEVTEQAKKFYKPPTSQVKKQIEFLIDKGYMERAENEKGVYNYLA